MTKTQFNIKISKDLLTRVKRQATMLGKSLTEHITNLAINSLSENNIQDNDSSSFNKIKELEERLLTLESIVKRRENLISKLKPFTNEKAINCTKFIRGVFYEELEKRNFGNISVAFDDFYESVQEFDKLNKFFLND
tara:strand:- start:753 stop:1163 length:411 start_codon:yes stop_codon:yes gene_type:complete